MNSRIIAVLLTIFAFPGDGGADETHRWSQFRGPGGSGIATEKSKPPMEFDRSNNLVWKREINPGISSPCIWGDRVFVTAFRDDILETLCIDRIEGEVLWRRELTAKKIERSHEINGPASPTPTSDGKHVFVYFGSYGLLCYNFAGELVWERQLPVAQNLFGTAASPIVANDRLIFCSDSSKDSYLEAIECDTGNTIWKKNRTKFKSGWSTPMFWSHDGVDEIVVYGDWWMTGYSWKDGTIRWMVPGLTDEPCITPVTRNGLIYLTSYNMKTNTEVEGLPDFSDLVTQYDKNADGQLSFDEIRENRSILSRNDADGEGDHPLPGFFRFLDKDRDGNITEKEWQKIIKWVDGFKHQNALFAIKPGVIGTTETEIVWQERKGVPECPSPLLYQDLVYMFKNGGIVSCLNAETGELYYRKRLRDGGPYYASPIVANGKIYIASARGVVTVLEAGRELKVLAHNDLKERIMATPAIIDGHIYVRTDKALYAFGSSD